MVRITEKSDLWFSFSTVYSSTSFLNLSICNTYPFLLINLLAELPGDLLSNNHFTNASCTSKQPTHIKSLWRKQDSNLWPHGYEPCELPTALLRNIRQAHTLLCAKYTSNYAKRHNQSTTYSNFAITWSSNYSIISPCKS